MYELMRNLHDFRRHYVGLTISDDFSSSQFQNVFSEWQNIPFLQFEINYEPATDTLSSFDELLQDAS